MKAEEMVELFADIPFTIDKEGHSHRNVTYDLRCKLDNRRCSHCGHIQRGVMGGSGIGCVNKKCIVYNRLDTFNFI